jgi:DNA phosphorothioation-dependent restriction protein DptF
MSLKQTIEMLSKGSAQAVTTLKTQGADAEMLKKYMYVETPVEKALLKTLEETAEKRIVFLCGSSGDGKSEIFRRIHKKYSSSFDFHLDATHSFDPGKDAIQTLDDRFHEFNASTSPLVIGINIGMLGNFAAEGDDAHKDIKASINQFLRGEPVSSNDHVFINFEQYPKFELQGDEINAPFIAPLLKRICAPQDTNPIYNQSEQGDHSTELHRNYALLCVPEVQRRICSLLFYAHLKYDQFLTARTVLDFVYQILSRKGSLFDNLFCGQGSELFDSLRMLDPCHARSKALDLFQVKTSLGLIAPEFQVFKEEIQSQFGLELPESRSWVRLFYVMQDADLSNNYHHRFRADLKRDLFDEFRAVWQIHRDYDGSKKEERAELRKFYSDIFTSAVTSFANRFAPEIRRDRFLLGKPNGFALSTTSTMEPNLSRLATERPTQLRTFDIYVKVGDDVEIGPVPVSVNFLELARKINRGYRPNTHDKTTVVKLEELVEEVRRIARQTGCLYVQCGNAEWKLTDNEAEGEIIVERR